MKDINSAAGKDRRAQEKKQFFLICNHVFFGFARSGCGTGMTDSLGASSGNYVCRK